MKVKEFQDRKIETTVDCFCNKCEQSLKILSGFAGLPDGFAYGIYGSTHLDDGTHYEFSLCEKCLVELFESFKIPVTIESFDDDGELI